MYQKILVPMALDHDISAKTLRVATKLLDAGGTIHALHVYEPVHSSVAAYVDPKLVDEGYRNAKATLQEKTGRFEHVEPTLIRGRSYRAIIEFAEKHGVECIVIGSHKPELSDYLLGSTAARVVRHSPCDVHVCRPD